MEIYFCGVKIRVKFYIMFERRLFERNKVRSFFFEILLRGSREWKNVFFLLGISFWGRGVGFVWLVILISGVEVVFLDLLF